MHGLSLGLDLDRLRRIGGGVSPPTPSLSLTDGLWAFWRFDGDAQDSSGNGNHLPPDANRTFVGGLTGQALASSGTFIQPDPQPAGDAYTLSGWLLAGPVRRDDNSYTTPLLTADTVNGVSMSIEAFPRSQDGVDVQAALASDIPTPTTVAVGSAGEWVHVAAVYEGSSVKLYVNGAFAQEESSLSSPEGDPIAGVGVGGFGGNTPVCNIGLWTRALSDQEIFALAEIVDPTRIPPSERLADNIFALYEFNGDLTERTGNSFTLTTSGSHTFGRGITGESFEATDRSDCYASSEGFGLAGLSIAGQVWTISGWLRSDADQGMAFFGVTDLDNTTSGVFASVESGSLFVTAGEVDNGLSPFNLRLTQGVSSGWHHLVVTSNGSGRITAYLDGGQLAVEPAVTNAGNTFDGLIRIGSQSGAEGYGSIDELALWYKCLTASEVTAVYKLALHSLYAEPNPVFRDTVIDQQLLTGDYTSPPVDLGTLPRPPFIKLRMTATKGSGSDISGEIETSHDGVTWTSVDGSYLWAIGSSIDLSVWLPCTRIRRYVRGNFILAGSPPSVTAKMEVLW